MALSGPEAIRSLDEAIRDIRREESEIGKRLSRSAERVGKIRENEAELFRKLAATRLDEKTQKEIDGRLSNAEKRARAVLKEHSSQIGDAEKGIRDLDATIARLAKERQAILDDMEEAQSKLRVLSGKIASEIAKDPEYAAKRTQADELQAVAEESLKKTEQAEADQEQKGRPYRQDPLFMYLWEAGYGTQNYRANNLVRWLDGLVARYIDFNRARPNFAMLNEIPLRLREHAERQIAAAEKAEDELDEMEVQAINKAGGAPFTRALEKARERLEKLDQEMLEAENQRDALTRGFAELAEGKEPAFDKAVGDLAQALQSQELSGLLSDARKTSTRQDDAIIKKINDVRARAFDEQKEVEELRERLKVIEQRRRELEDIEWEFKKSRFDDPRSQFRKNELVGDLLGEFLRGAITAATYWGEWQQSQSWRADASDWGGGFGLPRSGRRPNRMRRNSQYNNRPGGRSPWGQLSGPRGSNKGFSRPRIGGKPSSSSRSRSGSRGTRKSGGFKTGGGF